MQLALQDPQQLFARPSDVRDHPDLSREDKIKILQHWAYDVRDVEVAEEEGMPSSEREGFLQQILDALSDLGAELGGSEGTSQTKQGNV